MKTNILKLLRTKYNLTLAISAIAISLNIFVNFQDKATPIKHKTNQQTSIVGTWVFEGDTTVKYVFTDDYTCKKYFSNVLIETDSVIRSTTSPQCGITVPTGFPYMQMINKANPARHYCYEILTLTNTRWGIRPVDLSYTQSFFNKM